jgi:hypothetical protein
MKHQRMFIFLGLVCCFCLISTGSGYGSETGAQGFIGFTSLDKDEIDFKEIEGLEELGLNEELDLSDLISIGGAGYSNLAGDQLAIGVEYGGIFSGMVDDFDSKTGNGQVRISADGSLFLLDLFLGPQVNANLGEKVRLYCGAGPLLMFGYISADFEQREIEENYDIDVSENDTAVGAGGYVRMGIEFATGRDSSFGVGVRGFASSLDFSDTLGEVDFQGVQGFLTFSSRF